MKEPYFGDVFEQFGFTPHMTAKQADNSFAPVLLSTTQEPYFGHVTITLRPAQETATIRFANLKYFGSAYLLENMSLKGRETKMLKDMLDYAAKCSMLLQQFNLTSM
jgi:hypothetical protein